MSYSSITADRYRGAASYVDRILRAAAAELVALAPDVIVTQTFTSTRAMQQQTQNIPIIFTGVGGDPIATGFVSNIARPEGNTTGFTTYSFRSAASGWNCSKTPRLISPRSRSSSILPPPLDLSPISGRHKQRRQNGLCNRSKCRFAMTLNWSAPSVLLELSRTVA